jgi:hypothetical protein
MFSVIFAMIAPTNFCSIHNDQGAFMKKILVLMSVLLMLALTQTAFISCSGSSGGGGGDSTSPPATLDKASVDETMDYVVQTVPGCTQGTALTANQVILDVVATMRRQAFEKRVGVASPLSAAIKPAAEEVLLEGNCVGGGGNVTADISGNDTTGDLSGKISFNDFCQEEAGSSLAVDGGLTFSGNMDPDTGDLTQLSGSSKGITINVDEDGEQRSYFVAFNAALSASGDSISVTVKNFTFSDDTEGTEVHLQNFNLTVTDGETATLATMSGTLDVTDQGSVQFETASPLSISDDGETVAGAIKLNGANNTSMLVSIDNAIITVQADTDGDGTYDYTPDSLDCSGVPVDDISF